MTGYGVTSAQNHVITSPQAALGKPISLQSLLQRPVDYFTRKVLLPFRSKVEAMGAWVRYKAVWVLLEKRSSHRKGRNNKFPSWLWKVIQVAGAGRSPRKRERREQGKLRNPPLRDTPGTSFLLLSHFK